MPGAYFQTRAEIGRYFGGKTIRCLICGHRLSRLGTHLRAKHDMAPDAYRKKFGLPWTRGLTSAISHKKGWSKRSKAAVRRQAKRTRFFVRAHAVQHRMTPEPIRKSF